jgi:hypothetical protein
MISLIRSHTTKSLLRCGVIVTSLALATNAFAADIPIPHPAAAAAHVTRSVVARNQRPAFVQSAGIGQLFQGLFGLPIPVTVGSARDTGGYDPTFDSPSSAVDVDNSQSQAAIDASDQAMQQEDQSLQDMNASMAAAEQQNDAANAAVVQTDINAGM